MELEKLVRQTRSQSEGLPCRLHVASKARPDMATETLRNGYSRVNLEVESTSNSALARRIRCLSYISSQTATNCLIAGTWNSRAVRQQRSPLSLPSLMISLTSQLFVCREHNVCRFCSLFGSFVEVDEIAIVRPSWHISCTSEPSTWVQSIT